MSEKQISKQMSEEQKSLCFVPAITISNMLSKIPSKK